MRKRKECQEDRVQQETRQDREESMTESGNNSTATVQACVLYCQSETNQPMRRNTHLDLYG